MASFACELLVLQFCRIGGWRLTLTRCIDSKLRGNTLLLLIPFLLQAVRTVRTCSSRVFRGFRATPRATYAFASASSWMRHQPISSHHFKRNGSVSASGRPARSIGNSVATTLTLPRTHRPVSSTYFFFWPIHRSQHKTAHRLFCVLSVPVFFSPRRLVFFFDNKYGIASQP